MMHVKYIFCDDEYFMRLTQWTDYALRTLMYCAQCAERIEPVTITEIAQAQGISRNHLTKIVHVLGSQGLLLNKRGRNGGVRLGKPAAAIRLGDVVRRTESDFYLVECFDSAKSTCASMGRCRLDHVLRSALEEFLRVLDASTLADLIEKAPNFAKAPMTVLSIGR